MNKIVTKVEFITPAIAADYLRHNAVNRPLNHKNVEFYARQMVEGKWMLNGESIVFDSDGNLMDGQTRLNAVIKADTGVEFVVVRGVTSKCFTSIDQGRNRLLSDVFSIAGINNASTVSAIVNRYYGVHLGYIVIMSDGAKGRGGGKNPKRLTKDEFLEIYKQHADVFQEAARVAGRLVGSNVAILTKSDCGALYSYLVIDLGHDQEVVLSFFEQLYTNKTKLNHISILNKKLVQSLTSTVKLSPMHKQNLIAKSFNLFVTGKDVGKLFWNQKEGNIRFISNNMLS